MKVNYILISALCTLSYLVAVPISMGATTRDEMYFRVTLNDKDIGYHAFVITTEKDATVVDITAEFDVRFLFINAYNYEHKNVETWKNGCLNKINSQTDDNGERFQVAGRRKEKAFELVTLESSQSLRHDCVKTFAYWDRGFLHQDQLLNAQTGQFIKVSTEVLGKRTFDLSGGIVVADGYHITSSDSELSIKVWYEHDNNRWLALESAVGDGKTIRYLRLESEGLAGDASTGETAASG